MYIVRVDTCSSKASPIYEEAILYYDNNDNCKNINYHYLLFTCGCFLLTIHSTFYIKPTTYTTCYSFWLYDYHTIVIIHTHTHKYMMSSLKTQDTKRSFHSFCTLSVRLAFSIQNGPALLNFVCLCDFYEAFCVSYKLIFCLVKITFPFILTCLRLFSIHCILYYTYFEQCAMEIGDLSLVNGKKEKKVIHA